MEFLLRLIVDLGMVNSRLDPALALTVKLCRDPFRVLQWDVISTRRIRKGGAYLARETVHDPGLVWVALEYVLGHFPHGACTVRGLWEHLVVQVLAVKRAVEEYSTVRFSS